MSSIEMNSTKRVLLLFTLSALLAAPLVMLDVLVDSREGGRQEAISNIERGFGSAQTITLPFVEHSYVAPDKEQKNAVRRYDTTTLPDKVDAKANLKVETRKYSIYGAQVFSSEIMIKGKVADYHVSDNLSIDGNEYKHKKSYIELRITDVKGLKAQPELKINGKIHKTEFRTFNGKWRLLASLDGISDAFEFEYKLLLNGTGAISFVPKAKETAISLSADWQNPGFRKVLPDRWKFTSEKSFEAEWNLLNTVIDSDGSYYGNEAFNTVDVQFMNETDVYSLVNRSIKYGFLFPALTFLVILTIETLIKKRIHPVQYGFTGFALVMFFLLLLSLSEHINFGISYLAAAVACLSLIAFYIHFAFKSVKTTGIFSGFLALLYTCIYLLLNMGEYALLIGSLAIFAILASVMILTRKYNWYEGEAQ